MRRDPDKNSPSAGRLADQDPHRVQEGEKHAFPVPSRVFILEQLAASKAPMSHNELEQLFGLHRDDEKEGLFRRLRAMERDGQIYCTRQQRYGPIDENSLIRCRVSAHRDGFGFADAEDGKTSFFLSTRDMRTLCHGDEVMVHVLYHDPQGNRHEATVVRIVDRPVRQLVGRVEVEHGRYKVVPQHRRIPHRVTVTATADAQLGDMVVVALRPPAHKRSPVSGEIIEVLGSHAAPGVKVDVAVRSFDLPHVFSPEALQQAEALDASVDPADRLDLRDKPFVTIDGEDAKDFDDAVYCEQAPGGGFRLWVAIADVSSYVQPGDPLDQAAAERGNSVYFTDCVIPMLPERLSNDLCSLRPHADRWVMVAECVVDPKGHLAHAQFHAGIIHSVARLTYTDVAAFLEAPRAWHVQGVDVAAPLLRLQALYRVLKVARAARGALSFDSVESKIVLGPDARVQDVVPQKRNEAHVLIEECMLLANVAAAECLHRHKLPGLYRVHHAPSSDQIVELRQQLAHWELHLGGGGRPSPLDFDKVLRSAQPRPESAIIEWMVLRTMAQAVYSEKPNGHFGLAYPLYTHFTSPIRRYADLWVHRMLRSVLTDRNKRSDPPHVTHNWSELAAHVSMTERRADDATRSVVAWLKCELMASKVGQTAQGRVSGVASFGLFVQLDAPYVEGLVHVSRIGKERYVFDAETLTLQGQVSGRVYRVGDGVQVRVAKVDVEEGHIDFEFIDAPGTGTRRKRSARKTTRRRRDDR